MLHIERILKGENILSNDFFPLHEGWQDLTVGSFHFTATLAQTPSYLLHRWKWKNFILIFNLKGENQQQARRKKLYDFQCLHAAAALVDGKSLLWGWAIWAAAVPWQIRFAGERRNQISSCRFAWLDQEKEKRRLSATVGIAAVCNVVVVWHASCEFWISSHSLLVKMAIYCHLSRGVRVARDSGTWYANDMMSSAVRREDYWFSLPFYRSLHWL